ncbi:hypothetical protein EXIGLDRAFT_693879 [Exidia glandulosa HHB12029]|uniref:Uncharacterized protein n=1 Tax=Exidia glandulosa HHB12029 TaxID=1314781 RepID=A0A165NS74_EXIGL|nr:hypothetical protein EXIGLDRAFT_693879 [Exidia glandulosa HHB12029]
MERVTTLQIMCMVHGHRLSTGHINNAVAQIRAAKDVGLQELAWNTVDDKPSKILEALMRRVPSVRARASAIAFPQNVNMLPFVNLTHLRLLTDLNGGHVGSCAYADLDRLYTALRDLSMDAALEDTVAAPPAVPHNISLDVLRMDQTVAMTWDARTWDALKTAATVTNLRVHRIPLVLVITPLVDMLVIVATQRERVAAPPIDHLVVVASSEDMCRVGMANQQSAASHRSLYDDATPSCIRALATSVYYGALTRMTLMIFLPHDAIRALFSATPTALRRLLLIVPRLQPADCSNILTWRNKNTKWECALTELGVTTVAPPMLKADRLPSLDDLYDSEPGKEKTRIPAAHLHGFVVRNKLRVDDYFFGSHLEFYEGWAHAKVLLRGEHHFM